MEFSLSRRQTLPKKIRYFLEYVLFRLILVPIQMLTHGGILRLGKILGNVYYHCSPKRRKTARINLDIAFGDSKPPQEKNRIIKQSMIHMIVTALQCLWVTRNTEQRVLHLFPSEPQGLEHLNRCLERGKGVFFLMAHYGNWESHGMYWGYKNFAKVYSIARKLDNPYF
ncbi:MAG: hypothetical protein GWN38_14320, partial [Nitrospinaceae bacterium]|nr:hypothetical protein [Nitrospinaceae bacterium]NIT83139.1 hypothetical protein [Nitrospinaceae bacterium]NIW06927.1 hypothetical protein [Nitrospinaceae bacterium]